MKRFVEYRRSVGVHDPETTFHCLRRNAATALERARIPQNESSQILGHEKIGMSYRGYSDGLDLKGLREVVEAISYPEMDLSPLLAPKGTLHRGDRSRPNRADDGQSSPLG